MIFEFGLIFDSMMLFGVFVDIVVLILMIVLGSGSVIDLIFGIVIMVFVGYIVIVVWLLVGLVVDGGLMLFLEVCLIVDFGVDFYDLFDFSVVFVYEFGNLLIGLLIVYLVNCVDDLILLMIVCFIKMNCLVEFECVFGFIWFYEYEIVIDIVNGVIFNVFDILDLLLFGGLIVVSGLIVIGGMGCVVNGMVDVDCMLVMGGFGVSDFVVMYEVVIFDIFDEDSCDIDLLFNMVLFDVIFICFLDGVMIVISIVEGVCFDDLLIISVEYVVV